MQQPWLSRRRRCYYWRTAGTASDGWDFFKRDDGVITNARPTGARVPLDETVNLLIPEELFRPVKGELPGPRRIQSETRTVDILKDVWRYCNFSGGNHLMVSLRDSRVSTTFAAPSLKCTRRSKKLIVGGYNCNSAHTQKSTQPALGARRYPPGSRRKSSRKNVKTKENKFSRWKSRGYLLHNVWGIGLK